MEVTEAMIDKLSHLSRLRFTADEKGQIRGDLERMIHFVEKLDELDLNGVEPLIFMTDEVNVLREDEVKGSVSRDEALRNAPAHTDTFFTGPKVIKKESLRALPASKGKHLIGLLSFSSRVSAKAIL